MEKVLKSLLESKEVKSLLVSLKTKNMELAKYEALLMPLYENALSKVNWIWDDKEYLEYDKCMENTWMMDDVSHNEYLVLKQEINKANGFDLELGYCPLLILRKESDDIMKLILDEISKVLPEFKNLKYNLDNYEKFKNIINKMNK